MQYMTGHEIRKSFLDFFKSKEHVVLPSASLVPKDPQLMFTIAGMVPFKPIFWGLVEPNNRRVVTCQKCLRTNDIENVGKTPRHLTFFEMLGNFSFGDYFKEGAIEFAWEYVTEILKINEKKLWVTIYQNDDEAYEIWRNKIGIDKNKIVRLGKEDNWWGPAGPSGPCGPDSEIFIDRGPQPGCADPEHCNPACECGRFLEFWNLVFTGMNQDEEGNITELNSKNIDTGLGMERLASIMQGVDYVFDTDLFLPIIRNTEELLNVKYKENRIVDDSIRVIADHARSLIFMISDGILPSNEGRGYVLRRILRRALKHGSLLGNKKPFMHKLVEVVSKEYGDVYPELRSKLGIIQEITLLEEERFLSTLESGTNRLNQIISEKNKLDGKDLFLLHDTYGFPIELVEEMIEDRDIEMDKTGFKLLMQKQKERARLASGNKEYAKSTTIYDKIAEEFGKTEFVGYDEFSTKTNVLALADKNGLVESLNTGDKGFMVTTKTPVYPEKGGQLSDRALIRFNNNGLGVVNDAFVGNKEIIIHSIEIQSGTLHKNDMIKISIDQSMRRATARNHTATHLLHAALREVVGKHVKQAGSLVGPLRLRFDFSHYSALVEEQIYEIEKIVNTKILEAIPVETEIKKLVDLKDEDIMALFEEKYGDTVRVVEINEFSKELCGGTHVHNTGSIGPFKIISETSISAGVRRIEALTGASSLALFGNSVETLKNIEGILDVKSEDIIDKLNKTLEEQKSLKREIKKLQSKIISEDNSARDIRKNVNGIEVIIRKTQNASQDIVRNSADVMMQRIKSGVVILFNELDEKVLFVVKVSRELTKNIKAGSIAKKIAGELGGGGGGRPDFAQAGGKDKEKIQKVIDNIEEYFE